ncbi:2-C-methyl-D-erythritol 4-phosphate cytidylyltransferase [Devosia enhydra]|uniref:2-C-methyl-D-erythritol 4-phosphate cytidylyltransferase n=1 Tax=Devosia enhydra TaxID=665118 RepID=A0A1K2I162_9HYPH|nr:2-C-methyl-D-erythritol 4-phosphate cytidylyltransferase [Devosia enhydra]SFZ85955.1 2-C-methyl-D-erythritol 4-phosphate cytidylyltransferase [Devosia enhydra]
MKRHDVEGLIQAAGSGTRLGLGPKAFVTLGGITLLERAVRFFESRVDRIIVAIPAAEHERAQKLIAGAHVEIVEGAASRSETTRRLIAAARAPWLVLHDVVHPFAEIGLIDTLLAAARQTGASAPGLRNSEFLYAADTGRLLHAPGAVLIGQKPVAFSRDAVLRGYAALPPEGLATDPSLMDVLDRGGAKTTFVPGSADNIKVTTPADLRLAEALAAASLGASTGQAR